jgi:hypothetical protein
MSTKDRVAHAQHAASAIRDQSWEVENAEYHQKKVSDINNAIRGYNLQAPGAARKGYIDLARELDRCYQDSVGTILLSVENHLVGPSLPREISVMAHSTSSLHLENESNYYGLSHLARDVWKKVWRKQ